MKTDLTALRHHAVRASLFDPTTLRRAVDRLGFVQADPIRSPARAQDLILRHRVTGYKVGDLDRSYQRLRLEEDFLYAYGFMPLKTSLLLHPRDKRELSSEEQQILDLVSVQTRLHPKELQKHLGRAREVNAWGGFSQTSTQTLERLHHLGLVRMMGCRCNVVVCIWHRKLGRFRLRTKVFRNLLFVATPTISTAHTSLHMTALVSQGRDLFRILGFVGF
jgi:uncharacterized protein YcaQ